MLQSLPRYAELEGWRAHQPYFREHTRCVDVSTTPSEEYWSWNGLDVHLDRMVVTEAKLKVIVLHGAGAYGRVMAPVAVIAKQMATRR